MLCVDASWVIKCLVPEEGSELALKLYQQWRKQSVQLISPYLLEYEIGSVLRQKILRKLLLSEDLFLINDLYKRMEIQLLHTKDLILESVSIATSLEQASTYDTSYLLLAKAHHVDFITADLRFCKAASPLFSFVKFYKDLV